MTDKNDIKVKQLKARLQKLGAKNNSNMGDYKVGDKVKLTSDAMDSYSHDKRVSGEPTTITHKATSRKEHPGYDEGVGGGLYDLKGHNNSYYDHELEKA